MTWRDYVQHKRGCQPLTIEMRPERPCSCGLDDLLTNSAQSASDLWRERALNAQAALVKAEQKLEALTNSAQSASTQEVQRLRATTMTLLDHLRIHYSFRKEVLQDAEFWQKANAVGDALAALEARTPQ